MKSLYTTLSILLLAAFRLTAQDAQLTQFFSSPLSLNPAFTGLTEKNRITFNSRHQWINLTHPIKFYSVSVDQNLDNHNSSLGFYANTVKAGAALTTLEASLLYSYSIALSSDFRLVPGLSLGYSQRSINYSRLLFGDQLGPEGIHETNENLPTQNQKKYFDFSSGILLYNKNLWMGISASHLNTPDISISGGFDHLPVRYSLHGGYKIYLVKGNSRTKSREQVLQPVIQYRHQAMYKQVDFGIYWTCQPFMAGLWYRGYPIGGRSAGEAAAVLLGLKKDKFTFGYSYDLTISRLGAAASAGSHEISVGIEFGVSKKSAYPRYLELPCPKF